MAIKKPLVINTNTGDIEQLQTTDSLATVELIQLKNGEVSLSAIPGMAVYMQATLDTFKLAKSTAITTSRVVGLVADNTIAITTTGGVALDGVLALTIGQWDTVCDESIASGLTFNTKYYLSPTNFGGITSICPSTASQVVVELGVAISTTALKISIKPIILL